LKFIVAVVIPQTKTIDNVARTRAGCMLFSKSFVHVDEQGNLSPALIKQFLPARAALLADYWQKTVDRTVEKWRFRAAKAPLVE
jgi:hypothetical protein